MSTYVNSHFEAVPTKNTVDDLTPRSLIMISDYHRAFS